jgi:hypothetical protein
VKVRPAPSLPFFFFTSKRLRVFTSTLPKPGSHSPPRITMSQGLKALLLTS